MTNVPTPMYDLRPSVDESSSSDEDSAKKGKPNQKRWSKGEIVTEQLDSAGENDEKSPKEKWKEVVKEVMKHELENIGSEAEKKAHRRDTNKNSNVSFENIVLRAMDSVTLGEMVDFTVQLTKLQKKAELFDHHHLTPGALTAALGAVPPRQCQCRAKFEASQNQNPEKFKSQQNFTGENSEKIRKISSEFPKAQSSIKNSLQKELSKDKLVSINEETTSFGSQVQICKPRSIDNCCCSCHCNNCHGHNPSTSSIRGSADEKALNMKKKDQQVDGKSSVSDSKSSVRKSSSNLLKRLSSSLRLSK